MLEKLLGVTKKSKSSSPESIKQRENPYRKNWLRNIKK